MADNRESRRTQEPAPEMPEMTEQPARVVTPQEAAQDRQRTVARELSRDRGGARDETVPGGRYINESGQLVNAHGELLKEED